MADKFLMMARSKSHTRYFKRMAIAAKIDSTVIRSSKLKWKLHHLFWSNELPKEQIKSYLEEHCKKREKQFKILRNPIVMSVYKMLRYARELTDLMMYRDAIEQVGPTVVGVWNGQKIPSISIATAAKSLDKRVVYFENGLLPKTATCDWGGVNSRNSLQRDIEFYRQVPQNQPLPRLHCKQSTQDQSVIEQATTGLEKPTTGLEQRFCLPRKYLLVPFQVETDSQIISNSKWIQSMEHLFETCYKALDASGRHDVQLIFRCHPQSSHRYKNLETKYPNMIFDHQHDLPTLLKHALGVITINSTVGIEAMLANKHLMVLGDACYRIDGMVASAENIDQLSDFIRDIELQEFDASARRGFLAFLNEYYCIPQNWSKAEQKHFDALKQRLTQSDLFSSIVDERIGLAELQLSLTSDSVASSRQGTSKPKAA